MKKKQKKLAISKENTLNYKYKEENILTYDK